MKILSTLYLYISLSLLALILPSTAKAQIIISEVYPNPTTNESEYIELYNTATTSADLTGYELKDQLSSPTTLYLFTSLSLENEIENTIQANEYLVISLTTNKLNNSADGVTLINESGETIDKMTYENSEQGLSWTKNLETEEWKLCNPTPLAPANPPAGGEVGCFSEATPSPTPSPSPQSSPSPSPTPTPSSQLIAKSLQLNEIYPCPNTGEEEWIEIKNTSSTVVQLDSSKVADASGNKKSLDLYIFGSLSYGSFEWTSGFLNNSGDTVTLIDQSEQEIFSIDYDQCPAKGMSYIYHNGSWNWTNTPTKNEENVLTTDSDDEEDSDNTDDDTDATADNDNDSIDAKSQSNIETEILATNDQQLKANNFKLPNSYVQGIVLGVTSGNKQATTSAQAIDLSNPSQPSMKVFLQLLFGGTTVTGASGWKLWELWKEKRVSHSDRSGGIPFNKS